MGEEQRRNRELLARLEREKQLELENYAIRNNALEQVKRDKDFIIRTAVHRIRGRWIYNVLDPWIWVRRNMLIQGLGS